MLIRKRDHAGMPASSPRRIAPPLLPIADPRLVARVAPPLAAPSAALDAAIVKGLKQARSRHPARAALRHRGDEPHREDKKGYTPERVVAGATADTKVDGNSLEGDGAAFRSKGKWYQPLLRLQDLGGPHEGARFQLRDRRRHPESELGQVQASWIEAAGRPAPRRLGAPPVAAAASVPLLRRAPAELGGLF